jgi:hypothetical protein
MKATVHKSPKYLAFSGKNCHLHPKAFKVTELRAANKILRLATNSFSTNCAFQLDTFHGPRLERPVVYLHSCMICAAAKTLQGLSLQHQTVQSVVINSLSPCPPPAWQR